MIRIPYKNLWELLDHNREGITPTLRDHLRRYDRFYIPYRYESVPVIGESIIVKFLLLKWSQLKIQSIWESITKPESEALKISKKIFDSMYEEVKRKDGDFILVVLPAHTEVKRYREDPAYEARWKQMSTFVCSGDYLCFDMMPKIQASPLEDLDRGYDGAHYGPKANQLIADVMWEEVLSNVRNA